MTLWKEASPPLVVSLVTTFHTEIGGETDFVNASPKTWWSPTSYDPPRLILAVKPTSDTAANIEATGLFALHLPPDDKDGDLTRKVLHTAKPLPYGENELDDVGLKWHMREHPDPEMKNIRFAVVDAMPFFGCMVASKLESGDHTIYEAQVVMAGWSGVDGEPDNVTSVLLHRGKNQFVHQGEDYEVERY